jgi:uncharacterized protein YndB with AHSA1/START domain
MTEETMKKIEIEVLVNKDPEEVWKHWTETEHIKNWNHATDDWHTPSARNDLKVGGAFSYRMEARDESFRFDYSGTYNHIDENKKLSFILDDGRKVDISFIHEGPGTRILEVFEAEPSSPLELQKNGWQSILNNFKKYIESR